MRAMKPHGDGVAALVRPFRRLRPALSPVEVQRIERVLAAARVFLGSTACLAILVNPIYPIESTALAFSLLAGYLAHGVLVLLLVRFRSTSSAPFRVTIHLTDIIWAAVITVFTEGPNNPFFLFFLFALVAAAYRWGFWETVGTAVVAILMLSLQVDLIAIAPARLQALLGGASDPNRLMMRAAYLFVFSLLLGYLAEEEKRLRAETTTIARLMGSVQSARKLTGTMYLVIGDLLSLFRSPWALLTAHELSTGRMFVWRFDKDGAPPPPSPAWSEPSSAERGRFLIDARYSNWDAVQGRLFQRARPVDAITLEGDSITRPQRIESPLSVDFLSAYPFRSLVSVSSTFGNEWQCRLFLFDPDVGEARTARLRLLNTLLRQIGPALYGVYLFRRLRSRAGAIERARVARELHDGVIQSLFGAEMQLDVLRRQASAGAVPVEAIQEVQDVVRTEILNLRDLMQHMRPIDLKPRELLDFLADRVERFQHDTGISAKFLSELTEVTLPPRVCNELVRIVQEALVNVRKHSGAQHVVVRLAAQNGRWSLVIDDDGQGFKFGGRLSSADLDNERKGPVVIKERVRALGGEIAIESSPGRGARMEITFPQDIRE